MSHDSKVRFADVALATGVRLRYAEQGSRDGQPVLLLHGYSDSWFSFSPLLPLFPGHLRVLAPDQRGHGDSERPARGYAIDDLATDAVAFLDALGIRRAAVVGHSLGGMVALRLAAAHPDRVERLVLMATTATGSNEATMALAEEVRALTDPVPETFIRSFQQSTVHRPLPPQFLDEVIAVSRRLPARVWHGIAAGVLAWDGRPHLADVRMPTLIVWGDRDGIFGCAAQDQLCAGIPHATLRIYPELGHALHWEDPQRVATDLVAFIASRDEQPAAQGSQAGAPGMCE